VQGCARAASGHPTAASPKSVMNSRCLIAFPEAQDRASCRFKLSTLEGAALSQCPPIEWSGRAPAPPANEAGKGRSALPPRMSEMGLVSRVSPVHTAVRNCTGDEGGPFEVGNQVLISSHRKLLWSKAMVVSVAETSGR
jgi:hypothetical protein